MLRFDAKEAKGNACSDAKVAEQALRSGMRAARRTLRSGAKTADRRFGLTETKRKAAAAQRGAQRETRNDRPPRVGAGASSRFRKA